MFFRGRQPETSIWKRFRTSADGFSFVKEEDYYAAHVVANAERVVDLFHSLLEHMPPAVDVAIEDMRTGRKWKGESMPLPDVRDAIARLRVPLASAGGVEFAVYTSEDQLTLNPVLELFIYARGDHWLYTLQGKGLEERRAVRTKSWKVRRQEFPSAPELVEALAGVATTLGLTPA
ncbi:MAG TPA: hypothetical protein VJ672_02180 [Gemmatimonadaceae bacterium]|nr:hypothetical protein [Gemmatimonadaceae bacterium]